jgi:DnaK suppressor protein
MSSPPGPLTKKQLEILHAKLIEARAKLVSGSTLREGELRDQHDTESESMDAAEQAREQAEALGRAERDRATLRAIDEALARFEDGTYGLSADSGEPIGFERLKSIPWARLSVTDQEAAERAARDRR